MVMGQQLLRKFHVLPEAVIVRQNDQCEELFAVVRNHVTGRQADETTVGFVRNSFHTTTGLSPILFAKRTLDSHDW